MQPFHRLCVCFPSPCHTGIIRLPPRQCSQRVCRQKWSQIRYRFIKTYKFWKHVGILQRLIIKSTVDLHLLYTAMKIFRITTNYFTGLYVHKSKSLSITLSQICYQHFGLPWQINIKNKVDLHTIVIKFAVDWV